MDIQGTLISLLTFVVVLSLVVSVHEFGHFQVGRWFGVAAKSFSIGWGNEVVGFTDKHGTRWKLSQIPIGGFVSWVDDADASSTKPSEEYAHLSDEEARKRGHLRAMPVGVRAAVAFAGPAFNFIFAIFAFAIFFVAQGRDVTNYDVVQPEIVAIMPGTAAAEAGIRPGETVIAVNDQTIQGLSALPDIVARNAGQPLTLRLQSAEGDARTLVVTPRARPELGPNGETQGALGVQLGVRAADRVVEPVGIIEGVSLGAQQTWAIIAGTADYIAGIFTGKNGAEGIAGPFGIFMQSGQVAQSALAAPPDTPGGPVGTLALSLLSWAALLSVAIGFANLLPIPVLDGGHLVLYAIEALRGGKPLPASVQQWAFNVGVVMIVGLFLFATWNDISRHLIGAQG